MTRQFSARTFEEKENGKRNPNRIRRLFFDVVQRMFMGNQTFAAKSLNDFARENLSDDARYQEKPISREIFNRINKDSAYVQYLYLELLARYLGIPLWLLLLYADMQSNSNKKDGMFKNANILRTMRMIGEQTLPADGIDFSTLEKWIKVHHGRPHC